MRQALIIGIVISSFCVAARGQGLSYADNQVFSHGYVDLDAAGPLAGPAYPFAGSAGRLMFETSYRSMYRMKELTDSRAGITYTRGRYQFGAAAATFGKPDYFHQLGLAGFVTYRLDRMALGGSAIYSRLSFNDTYDALDALAFNLGAAYRHDRTTVFAVARALNQPRFARHDEPVPPELEIGLSYKTDEGLDSQVRALFIRHRKPTAQLSQAFRLTDYFAISWALVLRPARLGAGLHLEKGAFGLVYRLSHHPVLGMTHTVNLILSEK